MSDRELLLWYACSGLLLGIITIPYYRRWLSKESCGTWYAWLLLSSMTGPITVIFLLHTYYLDWKTFLNKESE